MENNLTEYNDKNRITYSEEDDTLYVWKAPCQRAIGCGNALS